MSVTNGGGPTRDARRIARYRARHGTDPRGPGRPRTHGLRALERLLRQHGLAVLDGRSTLGRELAYWRACLADDLGGDPSTAQTALIERVAAKRLLVAALETFILEHPSTFLAKEYLYLVNLYRQTSDSLRADLLALGLERRAKPVPTLAEYLAAKEREAASKMDTTPKKDTLPRPSSESRPSSTVLKPFSSSSSEEMPKKDTPQVSRGETEDDGS